MKLRISLFKLKAVRGAGLHPQHSGAWRNLFRVMMLLVLLALAWQCRHGWPVSSNLLDLVPQAAGDSVMARAQDRIQAPLSRELVALVGAPDATHAVELARGVGHLWRHSGLFADVEVEHDAAVGAIRQQLLQQQLALIPAADRQLLLDNPAAYAARRVRDLADPFGALGVVPADQDLLGLARLAERVPRGSGAIGLDPATATLGVSTPTAHWVLVRARTQGDAFDQSSPDQIADLVARTRASVAADGGTLLAAGGALYAAAGRAQAMADTSAIAIGSTLGIIALLLLAFRGGRSLFTLLPAAVGLLCGVVATVAVFGSIHLITLAIGASLIGIAVDFPLLLLSKRYGMPAWRAPEAARAVLPGLTISLGVTLVGYLALLFTPFPALMQTAVFSAAGLLGAYAFTVCELPHLWRDWQPREFTPLLQGATALLHRLRVWASRGSLPWLAVGIALLCAGGILKLRTQDDLRQWLALPDDLTQQARQIGELTGIAPASQFFLVRAPDTDTLWQRQADLGARLDKLTASGKLDAYLSLNQVFTPLGVQQAMRETFADPAWRARLTPSFETVGVPAAEVRASVDAIAALPPVSMDAALAGPLGESRRALWLGADDGAVAAMVTPQGVHDAQALAAAAQGLAGVEYVDRAGMLNQVFTQTRIKAAELKLASYAAAALLLWALLGRAAAWRLLAVPVAACACTLALMGYTGQPLTLFSLFGLLLVSAIGLDYAIVMHERVGGAPPSLVGIGLAALTTLFSFGLLALSTTPAIANFGFAVGAGVMFSLFFAPWVLPVEATRREPALPMLRFGKRPT